MGSVPAALAGTVDANGVASGIFESTTVANKRYVTKLTFVNVPGTVTKGAAAGHMGLEIYNFDKMLLVLQAANIALTVTKNDANITDGAAHVYSGLGTATATDVVEGSATATENDLKAYASTGSTTSPIDTRSAAAIYSDGTGTAKKCFLNLNVVLGDLADDASLTFNGTVELHYDDGGRDVA